MRVRYWLEQELLQSNMHRWIERSWDDFTHNRDYTDAGAAEKKAQDEYARERDRVIKRLQQDSNYRALSDLVTDVSDRIECKRSHGDPSSVSSTDTMMGSATLKLGYTSQLSAMESAALNADNGVKDALHRLQDAASRTRDMRHGFDREVRRSPDFLAWRVRR